MICHNALGGYERGHNKVWSRSCPGFSRLRLLSAGAGGSSGPVAFVDFASPTDAAAAIARLQGALLLSSEGAIHLEYARHKMAHNGWILAHEVCTRTIIVLSLMWIVYALDPLDIEFDECIKLNLKIKFNTLGSEVLKSKVTNVSPLHIAQ